MNKITIRPVLKLLNLTTRPYVKINDLRQVKTRLQNACQQKRLTFETTLVEEKYLEIINQANKILGTKTRAL